MPYKFFSNSTKAWRAMYEAIESARESVYLEMYIFEDGIEDFDFLKLLKEKAQSGVRVRIVLDYFGSFGLRNASVLELREAGAELFFLSYFFHRTHRKILVVDESAAFIGGVNFYKASFSWDDLVIKVQGRLVSSIIRSFAKVYAECGGKDPLILLRKKSLIFKKTRAWLVEHFPARRKPRLKKIYQKYLGEAKESITLVTPYFMPKRWFIGVLHQAVLRGVSVEVLVPKFTDHFIIDRVNYFFMFKLSKLGIKFLMMPKMNHAKVMIIDSKEGMVGSNNLDFLSFEFNSEVGVFLEDTRAVRELVEITGEWRREAVLFDSKTYKPSWFDYILSPLFSIFARIF